MKKERLHILTTALGLIIALAILLSNGFSVSTPAACSKSEKQTERGKNNNEEKQVFSYVSAATVTSGTAVNIEPSLLAYCIFEIALPQGKTQHEDVIRIPKIEKLFLTLFRVTIAPNAP